MSSIIGRPIIAGGDGAQKLVVNVDSTNHMLTMLV